MAYLTGDSDNQIQEKVQESVAKIQFSRSSRDEDENFLDGKSPVNRHRHYGWTAELSKQVKVGKPHVQFSQRVLTEWTVSLPMCETLKIVMIDRALISDNPLLPKLRTAQEDFGRSLFEKSKLTSSTGSRTRRVSMDSPASETLTGTSYPPLQHASDSRFSLPFTEPSKGSPRLHSGSSKLWDNATAQEMADKPISHFGHGQPYSVTLNNYLQSRHMTWSLKYTSSGPAHAPVYACQVLGETQ